MPAPTPAQIKVRYPAFGLTDDALVQMVIDEAGPMLDETRWGSLYTAGYCAYVAHVLQMDKTLASGGAGTPGVVASKTVGDTSISYAAMSVPARDAWLSKTEYGQRFIALRRTACSGPLTV